MWFLNVVFLVVCWFYFIIVLDPSTPRFFSSFKGKCVSVLVPQVPEYLVFSLQNVFLFTPSFSSFFNSLGNYVTVPFAVTCLIYVLQC